MRSELNSIILSDWIEVVSKSIEMNCVEERREIIRFTSYINTKWFSTRLQVTRVLHHQVKY